MRWKLVVLLFLVSVTRVWAIEGTLQEDFSCPGKNCTSVCDGPGGHRVINGYGRLSVYVVSSPPHTILQTDTGRQIMLGAADACEFAGVSAAIVPPPPPPPEISRLDGPGSPAPQSPTVCFNIPGHGQQCH
jgi:hypothetical protein